MNFRERLFPEKGLRVLVTAGASGIGARIASAFAETGADVHICDIDDDALAAFKESLPACQATHADVADPTEVAAHLFAELKTRYKKKFPYRRIRVMPGFVTIIEIYPDQ